MDPHGHADAHADEDSTPRQLERRSRHLPRTPTGSSGGSDTDADINTDPDANENTIADADGSSGLHRDTDSDADSNAHINRDILGTAFYTLPPAAYDTRNAAGRWVALRLPEDRSGPSTMASACGVRQPARSVSANVTVVHAHVDGYLSVFPGDASDRQRAPSVSGMEKRAANNLVVGLSSDGRGSLPSTMVDGRCALNSGRQRVFQVELIRASKSRDEPVYCKVESCPWT